MAVPGYVLKNKRTTLERAEKFISSKYFTDVNLWGRLYPQREPVTSISHYAAPTRIGYDVAVKAVFKPVDVGDSFGPSWTTHWFRLDLQIPAAWTGQQVRLIWDSGSEAMVWKDGVPLQGLNSTHQRTDFIISKKLGQHELSTTLYMEMACNELFGTGVGLIAPSKADRQYCLSKCELAIMDADIFQLILDFEVLIDLVKHLPEDSNRSYQALYTLNDMMNICSGSRPSCIERARDVAQQFFAEKNGASQHTLCAVANCHIDTAWLWPYAETIRKCARSWSTTIGLLEQYPSFNFVCSQAQQIDWVKTHYPALYKKIQHYAVSGRFIPVGGAWVEMDGNIPSGESFIRQLLYGQQFFMKEFAMKCKEFWLPDTFGYSAQLPQIMAHCGLDRFVTQKLSWNLVNKFPHHIFWWMGIDGTKVLTHFPPGDSYSMEGKVEEVMRSLNNFKDKGRTNKSLFLFGHGDGGQGPTAEHIERLQRLENVDGCPKVEMSTPEEFFTYVEEHDADTLCVWSGELYLELHNGTYTTHGKVKMENRRAECLLHDVEFVNGVAYFQNIHSKSPHPYPTFSITRLWKQVLLNQFHDVLPGTSINMVYKDVMQMYKEVKIEGRKLINTGLEALVQKGDAADGELTPVLMNTMGWARSEVVTLPSNESQESPRRKKQKKEPLIQIDCTGGSLALASMPSCGFSILCPVDSVPEPVRVYREEEDDLIVLENKHLKAMLDPLGRVVGLFINGQRKNAVVDGLYGNQFVIFDDVPLYWDAWDVMDYHLETRQPIEEIIQHAMVVEEGPLRAAVQVSLKISDHSYLKQMISLDVDSLFLKFKTEVTWHESHKFLKVEFPLDVLAQQATYEIQFGHLQRPTHMNTSWDWARYEVCGHKWADLSEYDWGVSILNDSKYGWSCIGNVMRLSLLRSSKAPDEKADMGTHQFTYAMMPHNGTFQEAGVIQAAYNLNNPPILHSVKVPDGTPEEESYFTIHTPSVILESVKRSEDSSSTIILRLYEAYGGRTMARISTTLPVKSVEPCSGLEDVLDEPVVDFEDGVIEFVATPFQIISLRLTL